MSILGKFTKQPVEIQDYDFDFTDYLTSVSDTVASHSAVAETGVTIPTTSRNGNVVKVFVSGGEDGGQYKISATITTAGGRVKQGDIIIKVKEF